MTDCSKGLALETLKKSKQVSEVFASPTSAMYLNNFLQIFLGVFPFHSDAPSLARPVGTIVALHNLCCLSVLDLSQSDLYQLLASVIERILCDIQWRSLKLCFKGARNVRKDDIPKQQAENCRQYPSLGVEPGQNFSRVEKSSKSRMHTLYSPVLHRLGVFGFQR